MDPPRRVFIAIALLLLALLSGCGATAEPLVMTTQPEVVPSTSETHIEIRVLQSDPVPGVYIANADTLQARQESLAAYRLHGLSDLANLDANLEEVIQIIYIEPDMLPELDPAWLRQMYAREVVIVGLDIRASVLGTALGVKPTIDDLPLRDGWTLVTAFGQSRNASDRTYQAGMQSWYYPDFDAAINAGFVFYHLGR